MARADRAKIGDRVYNLDFGYGTIIEEDSSGKHWAICFDNEYWDLHDGDGKGKPHHCWYCHKDYLAKDYKALLYDYATKMCRNERFVLVKECEKDLKRVTSSNVSNSGEVVQVLKCDKGYLYAEDDLFVDKIGEATLFYDYNIRYLEKLKAKYPECVSVKVTISEEV